MARRTDADLPAPLPSASASAAALWRALWPVLGVVVRLALLGVGEWQDRTMPVKFTDIDYFVFTDAARFVAQGGSPYDRETYRYTPLLAWLLVPNVWGSMVFGKIVFIGADLLCAYLLHRLLTARGVSGAVAHRWVAVGWLFNPFVVGITTRGSAEALVAALVLGTLWAVYRRQVVWAGVLFGLAVQFKAYTILYALPIYFFLDSHYLGHVHVVAPSWIGRLRRLFNGPRLVFALVSAGVFLGLSAAMYRLYGWEFVHETFLYHLARRDHRHNFSPYFYLLYLGSDGPAPVAVSILAFVPQLVLVVVLGAWFYRDLPFCLFVQTLAFVAFNKVCTSQYFIWYITFLPLVWPSVDLPVVGLGGVVTAAWLAAQALWLKLAYDLEFLGVDTFHLLWLASLAFFLAHVAVLVAVVSRYRGHPVYAAGRLTTFDRSKTA